MNFRESSKLRGLSEKTINEIMDLYYNTDITELDIIHQFKLNDIDDNELNLHFPRTVHADFECQFCSTPLVKDRISREGIEKYNYNYCPDCVYDNKCCCDFKSIKSDEDICDHCSDKFNSEYETVEAIKLKKFYAEFVRDKFNSKDLNLYQKVNLVSLISGGINIEENFCTSISKMGDNFSCCTEYSKKIIKKLLKECIIVPNFRYGPYAFDPDKNVNFLTWDKDYLSINISDDENLENFIKELSNNPPKAVGKGESLKLWKEIVYWECIELLNKRMIASGYEFKIKTELKKLIKSLITQLPISQIYPLIWRAFGKMKKYYKERQLDEVQIESSFFTRFKKLSEDALSGESENETFDKPYSVFSSNGSKYFFHRVMDLNDEAWSVIPGKNIK